MSRKTHQSRPVDAYKAIVDELVTETSYGVSEKLVVQEGIFSRAPAEEVLNSFVQSLSTEHRQMLAQMLHAEGSATIHDVLAVLSWWVEAGKVVSRSGANRCPWALAAWACMAIMLVARMIGNGPTMTVPSGHNPDWRAFSRTIC
jgi:hypothetical protein